MWGDRRRSPTQIAVDQQHPRPAPTSHDMTKSRDKEHRGATPESEVSGLERSANLRTYAEGRFAAARADLHRDRVRKLSAIDQDHINRGLYKSSVRLSKRLEAWTTYLREALACRVKSFADAYQLLESVPDDDGVRELNASLGALHASELDSALAESRRQYENSGDEPTRAAAYLGAVRSGFARELERALTLASTEVARLRLVRMRQANTPGSGLEPLRLAPPSSVGPTPHQVEPETLPSTGAQSAAPTVDARLVRPLPSIVESTADAASAATTTDDGAAVPRWKRIEPQGQPLVGWKAIIESLESTYSKALERRIRDWNNRSKGPIRSVRGRPVVDAGQLRAWIAEVDDRAGDVNGGESGRNRAIKELGVRDGVGLAELGMHQTDRRVRAPKRPAPK
jgi:hypothetical protein